MSPVKDADPEAIALDEAFRAAMDAPAKPREVPPPPETDLEAPHGRDDDGKPLAPFGLTSGGRPRLTAAGRKPKNDQPRVGSVTAPPVSEKSSKAVRKPVAVTPNADYSETLSELHDAIWLGLTGLGIVGANLPVVGRYVPEKKLSAEAAIFHAHKAALCGSIQLAAQHNAGAARFCAKLAGGDVTWVAMAGFMIMPFFAHTSAILRGDDALTTMGLPKLDDLAAQNQQDLSEFMGRISAVMEQQAKQAAEAVKGDA